MKYVVHSLNECLLASLKYYSTRPAIYEADKVISYQELEYRVASVALRLNSLGVEIRKSEQAAEQD